MVDFQKKEKLSKKHSPDTCRLLGLSKVHTSPALFVVFKVSIQEKNRKEEHERKINAEGEKYVTENGREREREVQDRQWKGEREKYGTDNGGDKQQKKSSRG